VCAYLLGCGVVVPRVLFFVEPASAFVSCALRVKRVSAHHGLR
jgi:hypothetical protein